MKIKINHLTGIMYNKHEGSLKKTKLTKLLQMIQGNKVTVIFGGENKYEIKYENSYKQVDVKSKFQIIDLDN